MKAALIAARNDADAVYLHHFEAAIERVIAGLYIFRFLFCFSKFTFISSKCTKLSRFYDLFLPFVYIILFLIHKLCFVSYFRVGEEVNKIISRGENASRISRSGSCSGWLVFTIRTSTFEGFYYS
jgi:hypothetical protein